MVVKIRLARFGRRKAPIYNIVVAQARFVSFSFLLHFPSLLPFNLSPVESKSHADEFPRSARNSKPMEVLGMSQLSADGRWAGLEDWHDEA